MAHSPESAWGAPPPERGAGSPSSSSDKEGKKSSTKSSETVKAEPPERQAPPEFARIFGREALHPSVSQEGIIPLRAAESSKDKPDESEGKQEAAVAESAAANEQLAEATAGQDQETSSVEQEREVAAEAVDEAQARNEQEAAQAGDAVEQAAAENVDLLLDNMEAELTEAPAAETAEHIIDRTTDEAAESLAAEQPPAAEMTPLDWPEYRAEAQDAAPAAEAEAPEPVSGHYEAANTPPEQHEQFYRQTHDDEPDQTTAAAPYVAPGFGQGSGGQQPPRGYTSGYNPNTPPPFGAAVPAAANLVGLRARAHEINDAFWGGFLGGLISGGIIGHWLGHRHERAKAERAIAKQERLHQEQLTKYEAQVAESQSRIRTLTERRAHATQQATQAAAETASVVAQAEAPAAETKPATSPVEAPAELPLNQPPKPERPAPSAPLAETRQAEIKTNVPKKVEMMTDSEIREASRDVKIGDKTLYELREEGAVTTDEERKLLQLAEQGSIEDPVRKYRFDQEVRRILMRHELDPLLAQQVLQHELEAPAGQGAQSALGQLHSPLYDPVSSASLGSTTPSTPSASRPATTSTPASHPLVVANIVAVCVLLGLLLVLLIVSITR